MEPQIQYARSSDGVSIAYWTLGDGHPLICTPPMPFGHLEMEWQNPEIREWYQRLAETRMLVRYDRRGTALSGRDVEDYSPPAQARDILALADAIGAETVDVFAQDRLGPVAIAFAAEVPQRLSRLVLWCTWARAHGMYSAAVESLDKLLEVDWTAYTRTIARWGHSDEVARRGAEIMRESVTVDGYRASERAVQEVDVTDLLSLVKAPTLVLHRRGLNWPPIDQARVLASSISGAKLVVLEGRSSATFFSDWQEVLAQINTFLTVEKPALPAVSGLPQGTAVVLFVDIADSTGLTERMGDAGFRSAARALDDELRAVIREAGGQPVEGKVMGDGVMAVFTSAREAIDAAQRCAGVSARTELRLHTGIHAGDVICERDNVFGGAVNIASRICDLSAAGEVLVSATVRDLARTSAGVRFEDRGERALKGIEEPVRVYVVRTV